MSKILIFYSTLFLLLGATHTSFGANVKQQLQGINNQISEKRRLIKKTERVETKVSGELAEIGRKLKEKQANLDSLNRELLTVRKNMETTGKRVNATNSEIAQKKKEIEKRLVSLYKAGEFGNLRVLFSSATFPQMLENQRYTQALVAKDRKMVLGYNMKVAQLKELQASLARDAEKTGKIKVDIEKNKAEIEKERKKKGAYLVSVREDKKAYQESLRDLQANSRKLQSVIARLEAAAARRRSMEKVRTAKKTVRPPTREPSRRSTPPPPEPASTTGFGSQRGHLSMPVRGSLISGFGRHKHPQFNSFTVNNGISIAAPSGTEVHCIYEGKVVFAQYFKGYGNMIIVDHGGGYYSVYAHASKILKKVGTNVSKNDILGLVGDVDSANGSKLYFEIRSQGRPVDPAGWVR